jgi:hypothetical protein
MESLNPFPFEENGAATYDAERLNTLLCCELSACDTYSGVLARIGNHWGAATLHQIRVDHREAADWLRDRIRQAGTAPVESPGLWSACASLVDDAGLVGMATVIAALKQGEQYAINEYEEAMHSEDVDEECREHIQTRLIPNGHRHILELDHMLALDRRA